MTRPAPIAQAGVAIVSAATFVVNVGIGWGWPFALGAAVAVLIVGEFAGLALARVPRTESLAPPSPRAAYHPLTRSQFEVAQLVAESLTNAEIAGRLHKSESTVDRHLQDIYPKLGIHSRVELTNWIRDRGLHRNGAKLGSSPNS